MAIVIGRWALPVIASQGSGVVARSGLTAAVAAGTMRPMKGGGRWQAGGPLAVLLLALASCATGSPGASTLPVESGPFLSGADVQSLTGFPVPRVDDHPAFTSLPITEWPIDNHGPCSNSVQPPAVNDETGYRYYVSIGAGASELIGPADRAYTAFLDALHDDISAPCDEFVFDDGGGGTRKVTDIKFFDVSGLDPSAIAWSTRSSGGAFPPTEDFNFAFVANGQFAFGGMQVDAELHGDDQLPSDAKLCEFVELALKRLTDSSATSITGGTDSERPSPSADATVAKSSEPSDSTPNMVTCD